MKVLVTGTSADIGRATAELFLERGHEVWGFDVQAATLTHPGYAHHMVDVRRPQDFPAGIKPEIIINNAGVQDSCDDLGVNLRGTINVTEFYAFGRRASDGWGTGTSALLAKPAPQVRAVVNVGSASEHTGSEFPEYAASMGGVIAYTRTWPGASPGRVRATASTPAAFSPRSTSASWTTPSSGGASWTSHRCAVGPRRRRLRSGSTS